MASVKRTPSSTSKRSRCFGVLTRHIYVYMHPTMKSIGVIAIGSALLTSATLACSTGTGDPLTTQDTLGGTPVTPGNPTPITPTPGGTVTSGTPTTVAPTTVAPGTVAPTTPPTETTGTTPPPVVEGRFGTPVMTGSGQSNNRWQKSDVTRDGKNYFLMANGWGPMFESQTLAWDGTSFTVKELLGAQGENYEPATYPTVFCGVYSDAASKECGLPAALDSITSLKTGWSWTAADAGSNEEYNAAYDVWLGDGPTREDFTGFFMVWLREPPGQQPAGSPDEEGVTVPNVPGVWDIWTGEVNGAPIINYVRAEGADTPSLEFDVLDFIGHAQANGLEVPGTHVLSVAVGFEIWNGPVTNLVSNDFYVDVQ